MITDGIAELEPTLENSKYLWKLFLRHSNKLVSGGVDDSNGTIGGVTGRVVELIVKFAKDDEKIRKWAIKNCTEDTDLGFEDLVREGLLSN